MVRTAKGPPGSLPEVVLIDFGLVTTFRKDAPGSDDEEEDYMPFWGEKIKSKYYVELSFF